MSRNPDKAGVARAWKINLSGQREKKQHKRSWGHADGSIGAYVINGPYHPFWSWWYLACVHLRPIEGARPAFKKYEEAEYEMMCLSLDPRPKGRPSVPDIDGIERGEDSEKTFPGFLSPPDFVAQFHLNTELPLDVRDRQAAQILDVAVDHIVAGQSCDSDFRAWWIRAITATATHYREGEHS